MSRSLAPWCLLLVGACSSAPDQPKPGPNPPGPASVAGKPDKAPPTPQPADAAAPLRRQLPNGITVFLGPRPAVGEAHLQLGLFAGTDLGAPGTAELAAETLVSSNDASQGRPSLRQAIQQLGGSLQVEVGPLTTWLTMRVPAHRWEPAQRALAAALAAPTLSRSQLERIRDEHVRQRVTAIWSDPDREASRAFLLGDTSTADHVAALLDRDVSEISLFQARLYRPDAAVLALRVPGAADAVVRTLTAGIGAWPLAAGGRQPVPMTERRLHAGVFWTPAPPDAICRATVILPLPEVLRSNAAALFVLHNCITLDGIGGRLEKLQRDNGLGHVRWRSRFLQFAETAALVLTTDTTPTEAMKLWRCVEGARRSLSELPPTAEELDLARQRAVLSMQLGAADAAAELRNQTALSMRMLPPRFAEERLAALSQPGVFDVRTQVKAYLELPAAMVVFGGAVPADAPDVNRFELLPAGAFARLAGSNPPAQVAAAAAVPWLDPAMEAVGGRQLLLRFDGYDGEAKLAASDAPAASERLRWRTNGTIERTRELLDNLIETKVDAKGAVERSGDQQIPLGPRRIEVLRRECERHPLALLAAHARGQLPFRPVAQRNVGDRDLMILEAITDRFDRLRIHVDTISHLIRVVEVWETTTDGAVVHLQDAWSDYRSTGGVRAPFRRITELDDGQNRIEAIFSRWQPSLSAQ